MSFPVMAASFCPLELSVLPLTRGLLLPVECVVILPPVKAAHSCSFSPYSQALSEASVAGSFPWGFPFALTSLEGNLGRASDRLGS